MKFYQVGGKVTAQAESFAETEVLINLKNNKAVSLLKDTVSKAPYKVGKKRQRNMKKWSETDTQVMLQGIKEGTSNKQLAKLLDRTLGSVRVRRSLLTAEVKIPVSEQEEKELLTSPQTNYLPVKEVQ